ncbi:hypothetical protein [Butyrivibrio sp. YAB3001]|uniref:hypothetical protein n=1 Tax=Butyrivibrio sp. YAB3001 TaxID=1520812 RepID=UPI0008F68F52|nr:hypothetical protein [Butyrivibrio sp. YAB3001]SFB84211.1 hypothetical protein SAMN02910398_00834 [Butyrivibrio sp. YAB3001]
MSYKYWIYGLNIESELEMPEAYERDFSCEPDVRIVFGELPEEVLEMHPERGQGDNLCAFSKESVAFRVPDVADFCVFKDKITVKIFDGAPPLYPPSIVLGTCLGHCMLLRKKVVFHGGGIFKDGKGVIVTGESGAGKSTVTDALLSDGFSFIADDVCAVTLNEGSTHLDMAYPQQKLCRDAAIKRGYDLSELIYINEDRDKFAVRLKDGFMPDGADLNYIFEIALSESDELSFRKVTGQEKLMLLMRNIYIGDMGFYLWGVPPEYMKYCLKVASGIEVYQISRPKNKDTLQDIVKFIEGTVKGE